MSAADITKRELDFQTKQLQLIFDVNNENYNNWLYKIQQEKINENIEILINELSQGRKEKEKLEKKVAEITEKLEKTEEIKELEEVEENKQEEQKGNLSENKRTGNPMVDRKIG